MIPKKATKLYKQIAEELGVNNALVEDLLEDFYKNVRQNLSGLAHPRLNVEGLGHFVVRPGTVRKAIPKYYKALENHDTSTFGAYYNKKMIEGKLEALIDIEKKISQQEEKKEQFKNSKNENKSKGNMEEQETNH
jgi:predicted ribosome quality control (RQC) complex YloA/Tae2 family protein